MAKTMKIQSVVMFTPTGVMEYEKGGDVEDIVCVNNLGVVDVTLKGGKHEVFYSLPYRITGELVEGSGIEYHKNPLIK